MRKASNTPALVLWLRAAQIADIAEMEEKQIKNIIENDSL